MSIVKLYDFSILGDERGSLVVLDKPSGVPFEIKRVYYLFGMTGGVSRGFHAHKKLHQIAKILWQNDTAYEEELCVGYKREVSHDITYVIKNNNK